MVAWLNRAVFQMPRTGATTHTVDPSSTANLVTGTAFTPAAGSLLVVVVSGAVTSTTPAGWTLPTNGSAINASGLYVWTRTAVAGANAFTTTHNGANYPVLFAVYEFAAGSVFVKAVSGVGLGSDTANPNLTGLTGTNLVMGVKALTVASTPDSFTWSGVGPPVQDWQHAVAAGVTDGYQASLAFVDAFAGASWQPTAKNSWVGGSYEALTFAVNVAAGGGDNTGSLTALVPKLKGAVVGKSVNPGTLAAQAPKLRGVLTGRSVNAGSLTASVARVAGGIPGSVSNPGTVDARVGEVTASLVGQSVNRGALDTVAPLVTARIVDVVTNHGTLNGALPYVAGELVGMSVNPAMLDAPTPVITAALEGQATNQGVLAATVPLVLAQLGDTTSNPGTLAANLPKVAAGISGVVVNRGSLNATAPTMSAVLVGDLVNGGTLTATTPPITGSITGALVNIGVLAGILPRLIMTKHVPPPIPDIRRLTGARITRALTGMTNTRALVGHAPTRSLKGAP